MLQQKSPEDFVLATGETHSVRQFVQLAFQQIGKEIVWEGTGEAEVGKDKESGHVLIKVRLNERTELIGGLLDAFSHLYQRLCPYVRPSVVSKVKQ